jgi:hypothetical protein
VNNVDLVVFKVKDGQAAFAPSSFGSKRNINAPQFRLKYESFPDESIQFKQSTTGTIQHMQ